MTLNEDIYHSLIPVLQEKGLVKSEYTEQNGGLDFYNNDRENDHRVSLDLGVTEKGFVDIYERISFSSVNQILGKFEELRSNVYEAIVVNYDLLGNQEYWLRIYDELSNYSFKSQSDLEKFKTRVVEYIEQDVLPFFKKFPNTESVNNIVLSEMQFEDFPNYIPGNCTLKTMIIMKMFANPRLEEYKEVKNKEYQFYVGQNSSMWQPAYDSFLKMTKYLGTT